MTRSSYDTAPQLTSGDPAIRKGFDALRGAMQGKLNCVLDVTLTASATSTILTDPRIGPFSFISFMPLTAHALAALPNLWCNPSVAGSVTVNHASSANSDMAFRVAILG